MASSKAATVDEYLAELPEARRTVVAAVRKLVRKHIPKGYEEGMQYGMIGWTVPLERYPNTYNKQPLAYVSLAAQKNYYSLYLMCAYTDSKAEKALKEGFAKAGKKLDMGKSCVRFKSLDDLPLDVIGAAVASHTPEDMIAIYEASRSR